MGAINSPHNIYLLERGLKTFELRMQRHNENGLAVAEFLASHPRVERVYYPGLPSHPYYEVAQRHDARLRRPGDVPGQGRRLASRRPPSSMPCKIARIAPSLGGVESLIEQPLVMSYYEVHARGPPPVRHPRQHDPPVLRHREHGRPDRRPEAGAGRLKLS